jgi:Domain of Unknown Function with PDB structure (DUF3857)
MRKRRHIAAGPARARAIFLFFLVGTCMVTPTVHADDWLPITQEELKMTSEPKAPGAPAIYLYRQVDRDDFASSEQVYVRIKILTQEGLKRANIEIPFQKDYEAIRDIHARTIRPDGSIVVFDGKVYDQPVIASRSTNTWIATFTMPAVEVGGIIECRYWHRLRLGWVSDSRWLLNADLFTQDAKFSLQPNRQFPLRWSWPLGLPEGTKPPQMDHHTIRLETHDVPAFVSEPYMPPESQLRLRVDFIYAFNNQHPANDPAVFWRIYAKGWNASIDRFLGWHHSMVKAVSQIVQAGDSPEVKLRKIYSRTQQIENLSYEGLRTEQEVNRENPNDIHDTEDVWSHGYGNRVQVTWLCLALARAAGIEAYPVLVSTRNQYFFDKRLMNPGQLTASIILVKLDGKEIYLAPGVPFTPFGMLPWEESGVTGLRIDENGGDWINTPFAAPALSIVQRKATLHLDESGSLQGKLAVTYTGLEALWRRLRERNEDGPARTQFLENDLKSAIPVGSDVTLTNEPDWRSSDPQLVAEFDLKVPGWVTSAGHYHLLPEGLFAAEEQHEFQHEAAERKYPIYFEFAFDHQDDVTIELPPGWRMSSIPRAQKASLGLLVYAATADNASGALHLQRDLTQNLLIQNPDRYDTISDFFQKVRTGDEEQVVISPETAATH